MAAFWRHGIGAQYDHVEASGRDVIHPFCCEESDAMERQEIDLFRGDELIASLGSQVQYVINEEGIGQRLLGQENDLSAASCESMNY